MSYQLEIAEPIDVGVRRIASELIDDAIARIEVPDRDRHEAVHGVRKNCKELRGLLRLVRPRVPDLYQAENRYFRDAAASLSGIRDAEAALESYDALLKAFDEQVDRRDLAPARRALTLHKQHLSEDVADLDARLDALSNVPEVWAENQAGLLDVAVAPNLTAPFYFVAGPTGMPTILKQLAVQQYPVLIDGIFGYSCVARMQGRQTGRKGEDGRGERGAIRADSRAARAGGSA